MKSIIAIALAGMMFCGASEAQVNTTYPPSASSTISGVCLLGTTAGTCGDGQYVISSGSWSPTVLGRTTAGSATYSTQIGRYTLALLPSGGSQVCIFFTVQTATLSGSAGILEVGGLPFSVSSAPGGTQAFALGLIGGITAVGFTNLGAYSNSGESVVLISKNAPALGNYNFVTFGTDTVATNVQIGASGCYTTGQS